MKGGWIFTGLKQVVASKVEIPIVSEEEVLKYLESKTEMLVLDVRTESEYKGPLGHIASSVHVPVDELESRLAELERYKSLPIVTVCHSGSRSSWAANILIKAGFSHSKNMVGGMSTWSRKGLPVER